MSEQPQEWTREAAKEIVAMPMINEYSVSDVAEIIQLHGNAALAAEREKHIVSEGLLIEANKELRDQLAAERKKVKALVKSLHRVEVNAMQCDKEDIAATLAKVKAK